MVVSARSTAPFASSLPYPNTLLGTPLLLHEDEEM
jgi:hypothetical protein